MVEQEVVLMSATAAKDLVDIIVNGVDEVIKNNYLRHLNTEIQKRIDGGQYVLFMPLTDLLYRAEIEALDYTVEEIVKDNIPGVNICWASVAAPV